jgi:polyisoprenyl-phosphate glycosyltransferase
LSSSVFISVVTPVYGCKTALIELYIRLKDTLDKINPDFEIIFVNDASPDDAWETIVELAQKDKRVKGINLSRNFGQHYAITAGLDHCKGEWVVVMDCDLQDQPEDIQNLFLKVSEGHDIVLGRRTIRFDSFFKKMLSKIFYFILAYLTETKQDYKIGNFGIYNKKVIQSIKKLGDNNRYLPTMVRWVGFKSETIEIIHAGRIYGKTSYSLKKLVHLALNTILSFSDKPLRITIKFGMLISFLSVIYAFYILIRYIQNSIIITGWTSLIISIWFLSGIIIFVLGIVGLYIGKTFEKVKDRPLYIIDSVMNIE